MHAMLKLFWFSKCRKGDGKISASGGDGLAGGGGGRIAIDVFSRHDDVQFLSHGEFEL